MSPQAEKIQRYVGKVDGKSQYAQKRYLMWTHNDLLNIANGRSLIYLFIHFIYHRLQLLVKNILIQIDKEIHSYHKKKKKKINLNILDLL